MTKDRDEEIDLTGAWKNLDHVFYAAFDTNHPAMIDYVKVKMSFKKLASERARIVEEVKEKCAAHLEEHGWNDSIPRDSVNMKEVAFRYARAIRNLKVDE